jgi:hypothetical protein
MNNTTNNEKKPIIERIMGATIKLLIQDTNGDLVCKELEFNQILDPCIKTPYNEDEFVTTILNNECFILPNFALFIDDALVTVKDE